MQKLSIIISIFIFQSMISVAQSKRQQIEDLQISYDSLVLVFNQTKVDFEIKLSAEREQLKEIERKNKSNSDRIDLMQNKLSKDSIALFKLVEICEELNNRIKNLNQNLVYIKNKNQLDSLEFVNRIKELNSKLESTNSTQTASKEKNTVVTTTAEVKQKNETELASVKKGLTISKDEFVDNYQKYVDQEVTISNLWFSNNGQPAPYSDTRDLTLRTKGDRFEDINTVMYFSYLANKSGSQDFYCRKVDPNGLVLKIPKSISTQVPNTQSDFIDVLGIVRSSKLIDVISITRSR